jgi:hypothetical protein
MMRMRNTHSPPMRHQLPALPRYAPPWEAGVQVEFEVWMEILRDESLMDGRLCVGAPKKMLETAVASCPVCFAGEGGQSFAKLRPESGLVVFVTLRR